MIHGADYSNHQTQATMRTHLEMNPSIEFALLKVSQGLTFADDTFTEKLAYLNSLHKLVAGYHYLTDFDGAAQWDYFESCLGRAGRNTQVFGFPVAFDYEGDLLKTPERGDAIARAFVKRGQARGFKVGKYGSARVSQTHLGEDWVWAAWWEQAPPPFPWNIWQSSSDPIDLDNAPHPTLDRLRVWWESVGVRGRPHPRKVWYAYDPLTGQTLGPCDYLTIGAAITRHLRSYPLSGRLTVTRRV